MADFDEDEGDIGLEEPTQQQKQQAPANAGERPPMKGWGDSGGSTSPPPQQSQAQGEMIIDADMSAVGTADEPTTTQPAGRRKQGATGGQDKQPTKSRFDDDVVQDITEIPDLEEDRTDDIQTAISDAPNVRSNRVQALQELDQEIQFQLPSNTEGIDLSLLTGALCSQELVQEPDVLWEFDTLFTDVSSEMQAELEPPEEKEEGEGEEGDDMNNPSNQGQAATSSTIEPKDEAKA